MHKLIVSSLALVLVTLGWGNQSLGDQVPAPQGELWNRKSVCRERVLPTV